MTRNTTVPRLLSLGEVRALTGVSADTIYRWGREGRFPRRIDISERCSRWREDEIAAWLEERSSERPRCARGGAKPSALTTTAASRRAGVGDEPA